MNKELLAILQSPKPNTIELENLIARRLVNIKAKDEEGNTALLLAAKYGQITLFEHLIKKGHSTLTETNQYGHTALLIAVAHGQIKMVEHLLKNDRSQKNEIDNAKNTALLVAAAHNELPMVEYLLKNELSNKKERNCRGTTALLMAASYGYTNLVSYLLTHNYANLEEQDIDGDTALSLAAWFGYPKTIAELLEKGAYIDTRDKRGVTARMAIESRSEKKFPLLRSAENILESVPLDTSFEILGPALNARQFKTGYTALHLAILNEKSWLIKKLLENGADILMPDRAGETAKMLLQKSNKPYYLCLLDQYELAQIGKKAFLLKKDEKEQKELKSQEKHCQALINRIETSLSKLSTDERCGVCLDMGKTLSAVDSPLSDPARACQFLNYILKEKHTFILTIYLNQAHALMLEILISKKVIFTIGEGSEDFACENLNSNHQGLEESKESIEYRRKCIIDHILQCESIHDDSLANFITQYIYGDENSLSKIEGLEGKGYTLVMGLIEKLKELVQETRIKETKTKQEVQSFSSNKGELVNKKLSLETEQLMLENKKMAEEIARQKQEIEKLRSENETQKKEMLELQARVLENQSQDEPENERIWTSNANFLTAFLMRLSSKASGKSKIQPTTNKPN